jgi:CDP-diacylglycerol---glycerol-3-phosphate 3-phosphatidyltransferase
MASPLQSAPDDAAAGGRSGSGRRGRAVDRSAAQVLAIGGAGVAGAAAASGTAPWPFLAVSAAVWLLVVGTFARLRAAAGERAPPGLATRVTLLRGWFISALAGFVVAPPRSGAMAWAPGALYTVAALCDLADGYVARRRGEVTVVGARLDVAVDALGLVVGTLVAIALGQLPAWYLALGAAYYLFHGGLRWRARRGRPVHLDRLRPSRFTRQFAGCQMGLVATALFPVVGPPGTTITAALFMAPPLILFVRDWLVVTGRLDPMQGTERLGRAGELMVAILPVPLRLAGSAAVALLVAGGALSPALLLLAGLVALGVLTRLGAFAAAVAVALVLRAHPSAVAVVAFTALVALILTGAGRFALWSPEDRLMLRRAGEGRPEESISLQI